MDRTSHAGNITGMLLMTCGMASVALLDALVKLAAQDIGKVYIVLVLGFGTAITFGVVAAFQKQNLLSRDAFCGPVMLRSSLEVLVVVAMTLALARVELSLVTAIMQTVPIFVTLGAVIFMGERPGWLVWSALLVGVLAMLVIVRPDAADFDPAIMLAVVATIGLAARDLASRAAPERVSVVQMGAWAGIAAGLAGGVWLVLFGGQDAPSSFGAVALLAGMVLLGSVALFCITAAMRSGQVGMVAPFRYTRLVFGLFLGWAMFGERLSVTALVAALAIVASGLVLWRVNLVQARKASART